MVRVSMACIIATIVILSTAASNMAQPNDFNQYEGSGTVTLEMYRQQQIETQLQMERQQLENQRQQLENQRQQLEMQRQQIEMQRRQLELDLEKHRIERQKKEVEQ
jgi:multidrug resistance efflux pump